LEQNFVRKAQDALENELKPSSVDGAVALGILPFREGQAHVACDAGVERVELLREHPH